MQPNPLDSLKQVKRKAIWINQGDQAVYTTLHLPLGSPEISSTGVIICPPFGYEYTHSQRSLRSLADQFASQNFASLRLDYNGTGDSFSDLLQADRVTTFIDNIQQAVDCLKTNLGVTQIALIGLRLGATLAAELATKLSIEHLILWAPCVKGKAYVRELQIAQKLASHQQKPNEKADFIDSGGFILSQQTADDISQLNLLKMAQLKSQSVLIVDREEAPSAQKLSSHISQLLPGKVTCLRSRGFNEMMAEPQNTQIPYQTIDSIQGWLKQHCHAATIALNPQSIDSFSAVNSSPDKAFNEQIIVEPSNQLVGILTQPATSSTNDTVVLLANSGSVHKVGPNRIYTELCRYLAAQGVHIVRFDLSNLGDSLNADSRDENDPYPLYSTRDIAAFSQHLVATYGYSSIHLAGLCSGAHNVLHSVLECSSIPVSNITMINPLAFYRRKGAEVYNFQDQNMATEMLQYRQSIFSLSKWKKIIFGQSNFLHLLKFVLRGISRLATSPARKLKRLFKGVPITQLDKDLSKLAQQKIKLNVIVASKDPGKALIKSEAPSQVPQGIKSGDIEFYDVKNADHTFSTFESRQEFYRVFSRILKSE
ncbi:serine aminopeptidase domain-containing protein [Aliikangiella sp. IMCC44653]